MSVNYDRFQGAEPPTAKEVGSCFACGGVIYDYEQAKCDDCGEIVHVGCLEICENCGHVACRNCLKKDEETLEWYCEEECYGEIETENNK